MDMKDSLISQHLANTINRIFIDIFNCKGYLPHEVVEFTKTFFVFWSHRLSTACAI